MSIDTLQFQSGYRVVESRTEPIMNWIAPSEIDAAKDTLEKRLLGAADQLRANSGHTSDSLTIPASSFSLSANTYLNRIVAQDRFLQTRTFFGKE